MTTTINAPADLEYPVRDCLPWCEEVDGHADAHPDDRRCWSTYLVVPLSRAEHKPAHMTDGTWQRDHLNVYAARKPEETDAHVVLHHDGSETELWMTLAEAEALASHLGAVVALNDSAAQA